MTVKLPHTRLSLVCRCGFLSIIVTRSVHNDEAVMLGLQALSPEGHSTNFYCKTVPIGDSHKRS